MKEYGLEYWLAFRDSIYEVGKPNFSIIDNESEENPDKDVIRITDCKFSVYLDISCHGNREEAIRRAKSLCKVLNADYPFNKGKT